MTPSDNPNLLDVSAIDDMPGLFTLSQLANGIGMSERQVRYLAESGQVATMQFKPGGQRLVDIEEVDRLERSGFRISWKALLE